VRVSPLVIVPTAGLAALFFLVVVRAAIRMRHRDVVTRDEQLVGLEGIVVRDLGPVGVVKIASEEWTAEAVRGTPVRGEHVRVVAIDGLKLKVEPAEEPAPQGTAPAEGRQT
jgi:membrane-bound serine protease (ClpP class)